MKIMNNQKNGIDWCDYTWNPVSGCLHNCWYCYAKKQYERFGMDFSPTLKEKKLKEPFGLKTPSKIFVCSVADLFGDWVPGEWINKIINIAKELPQHRFMFLTKNSKRYNCFEFPDNCWLGVTITNQDDLNRFYEHGGILNKNKKFISFEPLLGGFERILFVGWDLFIVGAMTGKNAIEPKKEWICSIKHKNIIYKKNIQKYL